MFHQNEPLLRVFMHRGIVDPNVAARSSVSVSRFHDQVEAILLARRDAIAHDDPELRSTSRSAWRGTLARQIMYGPTFESHRVIAWDTLVAELGRACTAYLLGEAASGRGRVNPRETSPPLTVRSLDAACRAHLNQNTNSGPPPDRACSGETSCQSVCSPSWPTSRSSPRPRTSR